jgi:hypothetical protein
MYVCLFVCVCACVRACVCVFFFFLLSKDDSFVVFNNATCFGLLDYL